MEKENSASPGRSVRRIVLRSLFIILLTLVMLAGFLLCAVFLLCRGPSEAARNLFVLSVKETSAVGFLAELFLPEDTVAEILALRTDGDIAQTDASLVELSSQTGGAYTDPWGYSDADGDGLIFVPVAGAGYVGTMLIVLDPTRVVLGFVPESVGVKGYTVAEFAGLFDAVAAINGGGFEDPNGRGNGSSPEYLTVFNGEFYGGSKGVGRGFVGLDSEGILHVGFDSVEDVKKRDIRHGTGYGPVLVVNGEAVPEEALISGLNPRTAIGQRSDGAILMLVIDGRQPSSLGATYADEAGIMLDFGAVNACNLDGGSSSLMWYDGEYINDCASVIGTRAIPTSFLVLKEGRSNG